MNARLRTAGIALTAAGAVLALFPVGAAIAADRQDYGSEGVQISVLIKPLQACVGACAGGGGAGSGSGTGALPATGGAFPLSFLWIATALLAVGLAFVLWQRMRVVGVDGRVLGRRSTARVGGLPTAAQSARADQSLTLGDGSGPDGERGDPQCRRM